MSGTTRSMGYEDNNHKVQYLHIADGESDKIITPEHGAVIMLLDRIATALEDILGEMRSQHRGSGHR